MYIDVQYIYIYIYIDRCINWYLLDIFGPLSLLYCRNYDDNIFSTIDEDVGMGNW